MKRVITLFILGFFCLTLIAQEEVAFNFSSKGEKRYRKIVVTMYVNGTEVLLLKNGSTAVYKASLDVSKPVTVKVKFGLNKQEVTFFVSPGNSCSLETSFFGGMLDLNLISGGVLAPGTGSKSSLLVNKKDLSVSYTSEKTDASDTIRLAWLSKGGRIKGASFVGGVSFLTMNKSGMKMTGFGGQYTISQTFLNFRIPENKPGIRSWNSFVFGYSETIQIYGSKSTIEIEGMSPMKYSYGSFEINLSPNIGYTLGLGKFKNETKWKGVALAATYKPSLVLSEQFSEGGTAYDVSFNYMAFGFDVNFNSYSSNAARLAPKAQSKLSFFVLPPIKDMPLFISVGYGLTFYIRRN
jgi:hypothetical protein